MTENAVHITERRSKSLRADTPHGDYYNTLFIEGLFMGTYYESRQFMTRCSMENSMHDSDRILNIQHSLLMNQSHKHTPNRYNTVVYSVSPNCQEHFFLHKTREGEWTETFVALGRTASWLQPSWGQSHYPLIRVWSLPASLIQYLSCGFLGWSINIFLIWIKIMCYLCLLDVAKRSLCSL